MDKLGKELICINTTTGLSYCGKLTGASQARICSVFEPKPDESMLIGDEEIKEIRERCEYPIFKSGQEPDGEIAFMACDEPRLHKEIAKVQLAHCEPLLRADKRARCGEEKEAQINQLRESIRELKGQLSKLEEEKHEAARAITLKEVGEWLDKIVKKTDAPFKGIATVNITALEKLIQVLKKGDAPNG